MGVSPFVITCRRGAVTNEPRLYKEDNVRMGSDFGSRGPCSAHTWRAQSFTAPAFCDSCSSFLWGLSDQGQVCTLCLRVCCYECADRADLEGRSRKVPA